MALRLKAMGQKHYSLGFEVTLHDESLELPLRWKRHRTVFVNSMSDLFHEKVPEEFILRVFSVMNKASWHQFQLLTKRTRRLRQLSPHLPWGRNIWMGVSVESEEFLDRINDLAYTGAAVKFVSFEPLLGPLPSLSLIGIDWVIVGGESGPGARKMEVTWVKGIHDRCMEEGIPFFFKQWGGMRKKQAGRIFEGKVWSEMPAGVNAGSGRISTKISPGSE